MNVKKTIRKLVALGTGATMVGATIMGAMANLSNYPEPFVKNGVVDALIVVGANAKTMDTLGAIDIAASLQANAVTPVATGGQVGTTTILGDAAKIERSSNILDINQKMGSVVKTMTEADLAALAGGTLTPGGRSTKYKQYLRFDFTDPSGVAQTSGSVIHEYDSRGGVTSDFLKFVRDDYFVEYQLEFTEGLQSDVAAGELEDLIDESLNIFGVDYTVTAATRNTGSNSLALTLMRGEVSDTLGEGETKTYTVQGSDYEVTAVFISDGTPNRAKFSINGQFTKDLRAGDTAIVQGNLEIGVRSILTNNREGIVEFYLGADKVELTDTNYEDDNYASSGVIVGKETLRDAKVKIKAANLTSTRMSISSIYYQIKARSALGSGRDILLPPGYGLREYMNEKEAMLNPTWDIKYEGLTAVSTTPIIFDPIGDDAYNLEFTNVNGAEYSVPLVDNSEGIMQTGRARDGRLYWMETNASTNTSRDNFRISEGDYFILTDRSDDQGVTIVLQYDDLDTANRKVRFSDLAGGTVEGTYAGTGTDFTTFGTNCAPAAGSFNVGGNTYNMFICGNETLGYNLSIDHNGDGNVVMGTTVDIVTKGGAMLRFNSTEADQMAGVSSGALGVRVTVPKRLFDEQGPYQTNGVLASAQDLNNTVTVEKRASNKVGLSVPNSNTLVMHRDAGTNDYRYGLDPYGAFWTYYSPASSTNAEDLRIDMPAQQRGAEVFVTAGAIQRQRTTTGGGDAYVVNTAAVGIGVLDKDVRIGQGNLIVVGGPCVNTIAMELMGNPEVCTQGFEAGKAVIKLYSSKNALLVAGYHAEDTLGAAYVLSEYKDYNFAGTELEVVVAGLDTITVNRVG